ncbi:four helix bundle protein [Candidatus Gottesmanbacteria bacterium]|nr:four helix bundle protein [Candidatus Gottesmanbacteria bacterium]
MTERNKLLLERIEKFVADCVALANRLPFTVSNKQILPQFIDSSSSVGANYHEACEAESARDFVHKIKISKKECRESNYWLRMLSKSNTIDLEEITKLEKESEELSRIFSAIVSKFKHD